MSIPFILMCLRQRLLHRSNKALSKAAIRAVMVPEFAVASGSDLRKRVTKLVEPLGEWRARVHAG
jgi:hypothetical protein